jgi:hypothetical protein
MEVGEVRHVGVLKRCGGNYVQDGSIRPQHQQGDRELIELHGAILGFPLNPPLAFQAFETCYGCMAMRLSSEPDDSAPGAAGLSDAQLGSVAEDQLATATVLSAPGTATVAFPLLDLGFDLYPRRIRTLRAHPVQVKARSFLIDGEFQASVPSLHQDPNGYLLLPYVPPPDWPLHPRLWAIPIPKFVELAQPHGSGYLWVGS